MAPRSLNVQPLDNPVKKKKKKEKGSSLGG